MASTYFCAVPPSLPVDAEGKGAFPAAGPYYVVDYRRGDRVELRQKHVLRRSTAAPCRRLRRRSSSGLAAGSAAPCRPGRGRLGAHARRHLLRPRSRSRPEVRHQPLPAVSAPRADVADARLQLLPTPVSQQHETTPGGELRPQQAGARGHGRVTREPPDRPVSPVDHPRLQERGRLPARTRRPAAGKDACGRQPARRESDPVRQQLRPPHGDRPARPAAALGDRPRRGGAGNPDPQRIGGVLQQAGNTRRALGHRVRALEPELHRSVRVHQPASRPPVRRCHELRPLELRAHTTGRCATRRDSLKASTATAPTPRWTSDSLAKRHPSLRSTFSTSRPSSRSAWAASF